MWGVFQGAVGSRSTCVLLGCRGDTPCSSMRTGYGDTPHVTRYLCDLPVRLCPVGEARLTSNRVLSTSLGSWFLPLVFTRSSS